MFESKAEKDQNRLYVTLRGRPSARDLKQMTDQVFEKVQLDRISRRLNIAARYFDTVEDAEYFLDYLAEPA